MKKKTPQQPAPRPRWERRNTPGSLRRLLGRSDGGGLHPAGDLLGVEVFPGFRLVETTEIVGEHRPMPHETCDGTCGEDRKVVLILGSDG